MTDARNAGVVHDDVEPAELSDDRLDERRTRTRVAHIGLERSCSTARFFDSGDDRIGGRLAAGVVHGDGGTLSRETLGYRGADAA